jgi:lipoic acid synthetase
MQSSRNATRLPTWFKIRLTTTKNSSSVRNVLESKKLHTVCSSAGCPNRSECWNAGTATFMILGNICSRTCAFCAVPKGRPRNVDRDEPNRVAEAVFALGLHYAVITSVTRDDLPDGGAELFAATIRTIRCRQPDCGIEVLIPDFQGCKASLDTVLAAGPDVLNHNMETVPSLYAQVRPQAEYKRSLELLARAASGGAVTKSGLMLGLGEGTDELLSVFRDLRVAGCRILTLGQYLRPGRSRRPVHKYYHPDEFGELRRQALSLGFDRVVSGPLVRSSYHAAEHAAGEGRQACQQK